MRIVKYPHPMLSYESKPLRIIDQTIRDIVAEMFKLMYASNGVGLAANQVDLPYQLIVVNTSGQREKKEHEYVFINPVLLKLKGVEEGEEGCLSYPGLRLIVPRAREVKFQAVNLNGELNTYFWTGFEARIIQHATDHLFVRSFCERATASIGDMELALAQMKDEYAQRVSSGEEPTPEQFAENVKKWESERS
jgi:peptide deformylase